mgnify:CR=1 FL=1
MKKILSQSPFFLIFFGILGYVMYSSNFDKKMKKLDTQIHAECRKEVPRWNPEKEKRIDYLVDKVFPCQKRKWEELGLYDKYVNWSVGKDIY